MDSLTIFFLLSVLFFVGYILVVPRIAAYLHLRRYKEESDNSDNKFEFCVLCSRHKTIVEKLIAGSNGSVCSACMLDAINVIDSDEDDLNRKPKYFDRIIIRYLDEKESLDESDNGLIQYLLEKCKASAVQRDLILMDFISRKNYLYGRMIISNIPESDWRYFEALNWIWFCSMAGDFQMALNIPKISKSDDAFENEIYERHLTLNTISVKIELDQTYENVKTQLSELLGLKSYFEEGSYPLAPDYGKLMPYVFSNIAQCYYLLGNVDQAKCYLGEFQKIGVPTGFTELLWGNIFELENDYSKAKFHWENGLNFSSRGIYAQRLKDKLEKVEAKLANATS
jgi:ClpX C4-type zinc finger